MKLCIRMSVCSYNVEFPSDLNPSAQGAMIEVLSKCSHRVRTWPAPPNRSNLDWSEEAAHLLIAAALEATAKYQPAGLVPFPAFLYQRVMGRILAWYRKEWAFGLRAVLDDRGPRNDGDNLPSPDPTVEQLALYRDVRTIVESQPEPHRSLLLKLFWDRRTEAEMARTLGISRRAVNKRKQAILRHLREQMSQLNQPHQIN